MNKKNPMGIDGPKYLFGAGGAAYWALQGFRREGIVVEGFLDDAALHIQNVAGLPVFLPDSNLLTEVDRRQATVILAIMNPAVSETAVRDRLFSLGWGRVSTFSEFGRSELERTGRCCSMLDPSDMSQYTGELAAARNLLVDDQSRQIFDAFILFVNELDDSGFPEISAAPYFPSDIPRWNNPLRFIDLGAFDGDSVRDALKYDYTIDAAISFEPDPVNFKKLANSIVTIPGAMAWPCGVADKTMMLRFAANGDTGSAISEKGTISIQCVALDDVIPSFAPNLIKLDIEGSEEQALRGAERLIRHSRPNLAVSVYHLPTDIWKIPLYLSSILGPDCKFYLRRHSRAIADTVLYVQPNG